MKKHLRPAKKLSKNRHGLSFERLENRLPFSVSDFAPQPIHSSSIHSSFDISNRDDAKQSLVSSGVNAPGFPSSEGMVKKEFTVDLKGRKGPEKRPPRVSEPEGEFSPLPLPTAPPVSVPVVNRPEPIQANPGAGLGQSLPNGGKGQFELGPSVVAPFSSNPALNNLPSSRSSQGFNSPSFGFNSPSETRRDSLLIQGAPIESIRTPNLVSGVHAGSIEVGLKSGSEALGGSIEFAQLRLASFASVDQVGPRGKLELAGLGFTKSESDSHSAILQSHSGLLELASHRIAVQLELDPDSRNVGSDGYVPASAIVKSISRLDVPTIDRADMKGMAHPKYLNEGGAIRFGAAKLKSTATLGKQNGMAKGSLSPRFEAGLHQSFEMGGPDVLRSNSVGSKFDRSSDSSVVADDETDEANADGFLFAALPWMLFVASFAIVVRRRKPESDPKKSDDRSDWT